MTKAADSGKEPQSYPSDALEIGTRLDGYRIQSILNRGTFGITYLAKDEHLDRLVAVKEYLPADFAVRDTDSSVHPRTGGHEDMFQYGLDTKREQITIVSNISENCDPIPVFASPRFY